MAASILGEISKPEKEGYVASENVRRKIKQGLIDSLKDNEHPKNKITYWNEYDNEVLASMRVRFWVVHALGNIGDEDVIPIIKKVANEDPYFQDFSKKENYTGPKKRYIVREEAQKVLERLKKEGKIKE